MGPVVKSAYDVGATVWGLNAVRFLAAAVVWTLLILPRLPTIPWRSLAVRQLVIAGAIGGSLSSYFEYDAYHYLPVAHVVVVLFTVPAWLALAGWLLRRRGVGVRGIAAIAAVLVGLALLYETGAQGFSLPGLIRALLASLLFGVFLWFSQEGIAALGPGRSLWIVFMAMAVVATVGAAFEGSLIHAISTPAIAWRALGLGIVASAFGVGLAYQAISRIGAFNASVIGAMEPVFAATIAWIARGESLVPLQIAGAALVIAASVVVQTRDEPDRLLAREPQPIRRD
jgi:drug/metabolite transporter, DME family